MKKTFFLFFFLLISLWLVGFQSLIIKKVQAQSMSVWTTDGGRRVKKSGSDQALEKISLTPYWGDSSRIEIEAARNEYEPAQIIVTAQNSSLSNVNVSVSDLLGPGGARISSSNIKLYREHYVNVTGSSPNWGGTNQPLSPNWYPDALIPFKNPFDGSDPSGVTYDAVPFNVTNGENQPIWVDFYIPSQTPAGVYTGTATVTASGQSTVNIPISLTVWDFEVPKTPYLRSSFLFWAYGSQRYYEEFLRHRLMPLSTGSSPSVEYYINNFGLNAQHTGFWSGVDIGNCSPT